MPLFDYVCCCGLKTGMLFLALFTALSNLYAVGYNVKFVSK